MQHTCSSQTHLCNIAKETRAAYSFWVHPQMQTSPCLILESQNTFQVDPGVKLNFCFRGVQKRDFGIHTYLGQWHYHESRVFKAHSSNSEKLVTHRRVTVFYSSWSFIHFSSGPVIGVDLDLSFLSVLALKFSTTVEHVEL